jgi:hypothetical protein
MTCGVSFALTFGFNVIHPSRLQPQIADAPEGCSAGGREQPSLPAEKRWGAIDEWGSFAGTRRYLGGTSRKLWVEHRHGALKGFDEIHVSL